MRLKDFVLEGLANSGVKCLPIIDKARPTTHKNAYRVRRLPPAEGRHARQPQHHRQADGAILAEQIEQVQTEAVVFSDFRHGIFNRRTIPMMTGAIPAGVFRVADSQVASRWGNILEFKGFDLITPNEREARFSLADQDTGVRPLAAKLHEEADCKTVILKLGDRGVLTCRRGKENDPRSFFVVDSFAAACGRRCRRRRCSARLCDALDAGGRVRGGRLDSRLDGGGARMRMRRQYSDRAIGAVLAASMLSRSGRASSRRRGTALMRVVVAGLGVQGHKRRRVAGADFVAAVDPVNPQAEYRAIEDVPLVEL